MLNWIKRRYGNPETYVLENGFQGHPDDGLQDYDRLEYYRSYINEMLKAVRIDGVNVQMYAAWTLLDDFEWVCWYNFEGTFTEVLLKIVLSFWIKNAVSEF